jgi:oligopeptide/dipeptide ABC transporter ATP-binding protein
MTVLRMRDVEHVFERSKRKVHAVNGVSLDVEAGQTVAVIGESGSGKSTLGRIALGLLQPTAGTVEYAGTDLGSLGRKDLRSLRSQMQVVFQEPYESLNPRMTVGAIVAESLVAHGVGKDRAERRRMVFEVLERVGLGSEFASRLPRDMSGGQQQRVGIARAVITKPRLVLLDEPTSSLDVSVRARVLELLRELQREQEMAYVFISHDLATVQAISDRVDVMYLGQVVESGPTAEVLGRPRHPYTRALISATLSTVPGEKKVHLPLTGEIPSPSVAPTACVLAGRCPIEVEQCSQGPVPALRVGPDHDSRCLRAEETAHLVPTGGRAG